jgi:hypothetical protein
MISHLVLYSILSTSTAPAPEASAVALALDPVAAFAASPAPMLQESKPEGFSYTFVEANYVWFEPDNFDENLDGFELKASIEIFLNIFLQGSWATLSDDSDLDVYRIGAGWHLPIGESLDLYGLLSFASTELDGVTDVDEDGMSAEVGARFWISPKFELNGNVEWLDLDESDVGIGVGVRWYFMDRLSLGLGVESLDSDETYTTGVRFSF